VVRHGKDANLLADHGVDDTEREVSCDQTAFAVTPNRPEMWIQQEEFHRTLELG
jgi:hypothetical protein